MASRSAGDGLVTAWSVRRPYGSNVAWGELFGTEDAARRYASARPAVHPLVVQLAVDRFGLSPLVDVALDVGCGAGLSTRPLVDRARRCVALDPVPAMVRRIPAVAPGALALVGRAEALPSADASVDLVAAAGSLDFVDDLGSAAAEIARVLAPGGAVLAYDFATGRRLRDGPDLAPWFDEVLRRWPRRPPTASPVTAAALAVGGLGFERHPFEVDVALSRQAYVGYLLTESFVAAAVGRGDDPAEIERWLTSTVPWPSDDGDGARVVFEGYLLVGRRA